jgi:hypothetical protein
MIFIIVIVGNAWIEGLDSRSSTQKRANQELNHLLLNLTLNKKGSVFLNKKLIKKPVNIK